MKYDIIIAGVGGQGILSVAFVLDNASLEKGLNFKQSEVHGMSQRGGAVVSNLRMSEEQVLSDLIPEGGADLILSMEPLEVNRYLKYLAPGGRVISNSAPEVNIPDYPDLDTLYDHMLGLPGMILIDAKAIARAAGNAKAQNMVLTGAASALIPFFAPEDLSRQIETLFKSKKQHLVDLNLKAFAMGRNTGGFMLALEELGVSAKSAFRVASRLKPDTVKPEHASVWAGALKQRGDELLEHLKSLDPVDADAAGLEVALSH